MAETNFREKEYDSVVAQFRALTEIRFKLLGLLPVATIASVLFFKNEEPVRIPTAIFGVLVTLALFVYHLRNDQFYKELVSRAAQLERELDRFEGSFLQRPRPWHSLGFGLRVEHGWPIELVYAASAALWLSLALPHADEHTTSMKAKEVELGLDHVRLQHLVAGEQVEVASESRLVATAPCEGVTLTPGKEGKLKLTCRVVSTRSSLGFWLYVVPPAFVALLLALIRGTHKRSSARYQAAVLAAMELLVSTDLDVPGREARAEETARVLRRRLGVGRAQQLVFARRLRFYLDRRNAARYLGMRWHDELSAEYAARALAQTIDMPARWILDLHLGRRGE